MSIPARVTSLGSFHMPMNGSKQALAIPPNPPSNNTNHPKNSSSILLHSNNNNNNNSQSAARITSQVAGINMLNNLSKHNRSSNHAAAPAAQPAAASGNAALPGTSALRLHPINLVGHNCCSATINSSY